MYNTTKPTIITAQQYGTKVSVELDHSDTDIGELFDIFQTICVGLGYSDSSWKSFILEKAEEYKEDESDNSIDMGVVSLSKEQQKVISDYVANLPEEDIDEALIQHNTDEFNDYGMRINKTK